MGPTFGAGLLDERAAAGGLFGAAIYQSKTSTSCLIAKVRGNRSSSRVPGFRGGSQLNTKLFLLNFIWSISGLKAAVRHIRNLQIYNWSKQGIGFIKPKP